MIDIDELERLAKAAGGEAWKQYGSLIAGSTTVCIMAEPTTTTNTRELEITSPDWKKQMEAAAFIAAANPAAVLELVAEVKRLRETLEKVRRGHTYCEDSWYSCPKAEEGCADDSQGDECNCGADRINAIIDEALRGGE